MSMESVFLKITGQKLTKYVGCNCDRESRKKTRSAKG